MERYGIFWSGGKDSVLTLWYLLQEKKSISHLITTLTLPYYRVTMHGVPIRTLKRQIHYLKIPLKVEFVPLLQSTSNIAYIDIHKQRFHKWKNEFKLTHLAFGDIFLTDVRNFREQLFKSSFQLAFPLWGKSTDQLAKIFIENHFKAIIVCVDKQKIPSDWIGKEYSLTFLQQLPQNVDPCGENGEFHTFVYNGPIFKNPIPFALGQIYETDQFIYQEPIPI